MVNKKTTITFDEFSTLIDEAKKTMKTDECAALNTLHASMSQLDRTFNDWALTHASAYERDALLANKSDKQSDKLRELNPQLSNFHELYQAALLLSRILIEAKPETFLNEITLLNMSVNLVINLINKNEAFIDNALFNKLLSEISIIADRRNSSWRKTELAGVVTLCICAYLASLIGLGSLIALPFWAPAASHSLSAPLFMFLAFLPFVVAQVLMCGAGVAGSLASFANEQSEYNRHRFMFAASARSQYKASRKAIEQSGEVVFLELDGTTSANTTPKEETATEQRDEVVLNLGDITPASAETDDIISEQDDYGSAPAM